mmetsp:Transcript_25475/g.60269  ORF Transcript_25475/g.60269 Transcript_25475/m.60269 type:complete len:167 (+) Transcript_25475:133-633(+)
MHEKKRSGPTVILFLGEKYNPSPNYRSASLSNALQRDCVSIKRAIIGYSWWTLRLKLKSHCLAPKRCIPSSFLCCWGPSMLLRLFVVVTTNIDSSSNLDRTDPSNLDLTETAAVDLLLFLFAQLLLLLDPPPSDAAAATPSVTNEENEEEPRDAANRLLNDWFWFF